MPNTEKIERVTALTEEIRGSAALLLADYRGLTVAEIGELRRSLREADTSFAVVKNTLMSRAVVEAGMDDLTVFFTGPSAVAFVHGDPVAAAKKLKAATKLFPALSLKGAYLDGAVLDADAANGLADLESREVMLSKIAGMLQSEFTRAASMLVTVQSRFLSVLEAYRAKLPGEAGATDEPEASEEPAVEASEEPTPGAEDGSAETADEPTPETADEPTPETATEPTTQEE
jgi:large subunit ribosomal protein L10